MGIKKEGGAKTQVEANNKELNTTIFSADEMQRDEPWRERDRELSNVYRSYIVLWKNILDEALDGARNCTQEHSNPPSSFLFPASSLFLSLLPDPLHINSPACGVCLQVSN